MPPEHCFQRQSIKAGEQREEAEDLSYVVLWRPWGELSSE
jgi:hypothetical protein